MERSERPNLRVAEYSKLIFRLSYRDTVLQDLDTKYAVNSAGLPPLILPVNTSEASSIDTVNVERLSSSSIVEVAARYFLIRLSGAAMNLVPIPSF